MSRPLETAQPRLQQPQQQQQQNTAGILTGFFYFYSFAASGNALGQAFVYLSQRLRMTHQKKQQQHISLCAAAAAEYAV